MRSHRSSHRIHRSSLSRKTHTSSMHKSSFRKHGISNAHAFAVGKTTGVNINGSALGAHGAAIHRMKKMRERNSIHRHTSMFNKSYASKHKSRDFINKMHVSNNKHRYTSKKYNYSNIEKVGEEFNNVINEASKYVWIPILMFIIIFICFIFMTLFILNIGLKLF